MRSLIDVNWTEIKCEAVSHRYPEPRGLNESFRDQPSKDQTENILESFLLLAQLCILGDDGARLSPLSCLNWDCQLRNCVAGSNKVGRREGRKLGRGVMESRNVEYSCKEKGRGGGRCFLL